MRLTFSAFLLLVAASAAADDVYLPLGGGAWRTELQIVNRSASRTVVAIEVLGNGTRRIGLDAGQTMRWDAAGPGQEIGALRVGADAAIDVSAVSRCAACGSGVTVPILATRHAVEEGAVPIRASLPWRGGMVAVNPGDEVAIMTVSRGDGIVASFSIPARGVRRLDGDERDRLTVRSTRPLLLFGYDRNERTGALVFTPVTPQAHGGKRRSVRSGSPPTTPEPQTITLTPSKDNTLFESAAGTLSNGAGVHLFAGATASGSLRRALLGFDVASQIPPGSRITRATLVLRVSQSIAGPEPMTLHRLSADWGEGASNAGSSRDGIGAAAQTGDATWRHRFFPGQPWAAQGGDFDQAADATAAVQGTAVWESSEAMIARVQGWLDQPSTNFGWIVIGNEAEITTAKRFDSREVATPATRPVLTIEFLR